MELFNTSISSVMTLAVICFAGAWLSHKGILHIQLRKQMSRIVFYMMLPALLCVKTAGNVSLESLKTLWFVPVMSLVITCLGLGLGIVAARISKPLPKFRNHIITATALGNHGYLVIPLMYTLTQTSPLFNSDPEASGRAMMYIAMYLMMQSCLLWGIGHTFLSGEKLKDLDFHQIITPPIKGIFIGLAIGCIPFLQSLFFTKESSLFFVSQGAEIIGKGAVPCALLILGANLKEATGKTSIHLKSIVAATTTRLVVLPTAGMALIMLLVKLNIIPSKDPVLIMLLLVQTCVPSATNLMLMCEIHKRGEKEMASILLWLYLASIVTMTIWLQIFQMVLR